MSALTFIDLAAKSATVLTAGFAVQLLWRKASAAQRSVLWLAVFAALALLPITLLVEPRWWLGTQQQAAMVPVAETRYLAHETDLEAVAVASERAAPPAVRQPLLRRSLTEWLAAVWLAGVIAIMAYRWLGTWRIRSLLATSTPISAVLQNRVDDLAASLRLHRRVQVRSATSAKVPVTWGTWKPVVLLPAEAAEWPLDEFKAALLHELAHIRHHDAASRWLATCVCALQWPNLFVWLAARKWRLVQEQAADDVVLRRGACPEAYAEQLLRAVRSFRGDGDVSAPVLAMARPSTLEQRMLAIIEPMRNRHGVGAGYASCLVVMAILMVAALATLSLRAQTHGPAAPRPDTTPQETAADVPSIVIEMKFFEVAANNLQEDTHDLLGKALSEEQANSVVRRWLQGAQISLLSYPRMVTLNQREVTMKSVVNVPVPGGKPVEIGTRATVLPSVRGDHIELSVDIEISKSVGEANGAPVVSSKSVTTTLPLPNGSTAIYRLPEAGKAAESGGAAADVFCLIRAERLPHGSMPFGRMMTLGIVIPRLHFNEASLEEALEFLRIKGGRDKKAANIIATSLETDAKITLDLKDVSLHDALSHVADATRMDLEYVANAAVLMPKGSSLKGLGWQDKDAKAPAAVAARQLIYPRMKLHKALLTEAVSFVREEGRRHKGEGESFDVVLKSAAEIGMRPVSFELCDTSFLDILHHIATLSGCKLTAEGNALIVEPAD